MGGESYLITAQFKFGGDKPHFSIAAMLCDLDEKPWDEFLIKIFASSSNGRGVIQEVVHGRVLMSQQLDKLVH